jgi:hypothetical protein
MLLYLYLIDGTPRAGTDLHQIQAALEDKLRERRDVSDVWWSEERPYIPRVYLYGGSHSDYEADVSAGVDPQFDWEEQDQLIFPMDLAEPGKTVISPLDTLGPVVVQLSMTLTTQEGTRTITRGFPEQNWPRDAKSRADCLKAFNRDVEWVLINEWIKKEGS